MDMPRCPMWLAHDLAYIGQLIKPVQCSYCCRYRPPLHWSKIVHKQPQQILCGDVESPSDKPNVYPTTAARGRSVGPLYSESDAYA